MRILPYLLVAPLLASCSTAPPVQSADQIARTQARLAELTAGRVAGAPVACLPSYDADDMTIIPGGTVAFRDGAKRLYVNDMQGSCPNLRDTNTLVTRSALTQLCRGEIAQLIDSSTRTFVGSCVFGDFVPYTKP
jgi:hypothetical protein